MCGPFSSNNLFLFILLLHFLWIYMNFHIIQVMFHIIFITTLQIVLLASLKMTEIINISN